VTIAVSSVPNQLNSYFGLAGNSNGPLIVSSGPSCAPHWSDSGLGSRPWVRVSMSVTGQLQSAVSSTDASSVWVSGSYGKEGSWVQQSLAMDWATVGVTVASVTSLQYFALSGDGTVQLVGGQGGAMRSSTCRAIDTGDSNCLTCAGPPWSAVCTGCRDGYALWTFGSGISCSLRKLIWRFLS
jgi:hypothetical protein